MSFFTKFKNKKFAIIVGGVLIVTLGIGVFIYNKNKNKDDLIDSGDIPVETYTVADNEKIFINGSIVPTKSQDFTPTEEISKLNVTNGKIVKNGDLLYTVKNQAILDEIDGLKAQVSELKKINKANTEKDPILTTEINKINAQISALEKKAYTNTYAPFDGKVYLNEQSENTSELSSYMTVISTEFYMKGQASEQDLPKLQIDDYVDVLVFSNDQNLNGRISFISDRPSTNADNMNMGGQGNLSYYDINISFEDQEGLVNGFHVQASIEIKDSLSKIPTTAIVETETETYVFKDMNGILKKQIVEVQSKNEEFAVISSGLDKKDVIIRYANESMSEGDAINSATDSMGEESIPQTSEEGVE